MGTYNNFQKKMDQDSVQEKVNRTNPIAYLKEMQIFLYFGLKLEKQLYSIQRREEKGATKIESMTKFLFTVNVREANTMF
jgi:hypothetical protein